MLVDENQKILEACVWFESPSACQKLRVAPMRCCRRGRHCVRELCGCGRDESRRLKEKNAGGLVAESD